MGTLFKTSGAVSSQKYHNKSQWLTLLKKQSKGGSQWPIEGIHCRMEKDQGEGGGGAQEAEGEAGKEEENEKKAKEAEEKKKRLEEAEAKRQEMLDAQKA